MKAKGSVFPKIIYKDAVWRFFKYGFTVVLLIYFLFYWHYLRTVADWQESHRFLDMLATLIIPYTFISFIVIVIIFAFLARRLVQPIGQFWGSLLSFSANIKERKVNDGDIVPELFQEEIGEWAEINQALLKIEQEVSAEQIRHSLEQTEMRTIMDSVTDAIIAVDCDLHVLFFNKNVNKIFGTGLIKDRMGYLTDLIRNPDVLNQFRKVLLSGEVVELEVELEIGAMSTRKFFSVAVAPLRRDKSMKIYGAVGIIHDISGLKQGEKMRIEFVANASHELRTPLTLVHGYLETIKEDIAKGEQDQVQEFLQVVSRNVRRLQSLVTDLLDLSAIESGSPIHRAFLEPKAICEEVISRLSSPNGNVRERIKVIVDGGKVYADPLRLNQVLTNLIDNAIKYTAEGTNIDVIWQRYSDGVELLVRDHGAGIAQEHLPRLFERFYRVDEGRSSARGGTGLGLAIVKHIMIRHRGEVSVTSEENVGTTFRCRFPDSKTIEARAGN